MEQMIQGKQNNCNIFADPKEKIIRAAIEIVVRADGNGRIAELGHDIISYAKELEVCECSTIL